MYLKEERSQREIARETGIDRKTVSKYIKEQENKQKEQSHDAVHTEELILELVEALKYKVGIRTKRVMTKEIEQK